MRSGTENVPAIAGFGAACDYVRENLRERLRRMEELKQRCLAGIPQAVPEAVILGSHDAPHIISFGIPGLRSQGIIGALEERGIEVSAGSACSRGHRSHVLEAMGLPPEVVDGAFRISLSRFTAEEELAQLEAGLRAVVERMRRP